MVDALGAAVGAGALLITYGVGAAPAAYNQTGVRGFCSAEDGVLRANPNTGARSRPRKRVVRRTAQRAYLVLQ